MIHTESQSSDQSLLLGVLTQLNPPVLLLAGDHLLSFLALLLSSCALIMSVESTSGSESLSHSSSAEIVVTFPPGKHADFVLHYDNNTAFHVHKLVLHHHAAYFRTYFDTLSTQLRSSDSCKHAHIAHCIHLPSQTKLVQETPVTAIDMGLFLRHLYFAAHYCCPPHLPKTDVDIGADPPPAVSLQFSNVQQLNWLADSTPLRLNDDRNFVYHESLQTSPTTSTVVS